MTSSLTSLARAWAMTSRPAAVVVVAEGLATSRARTALTVAPCPGALGRAWCAYPAVGAAYPDDRVRPAHRRAAPLARGGRAGDRAGGRGPLRRRRRAARARGHP